ncbi:MAG: hypothetical protein ACFFCE_04635 [Promethearchaeota archaeon]
MNLDIIDKAQKKVKEILKRHKSYLLESELEKKLDEYIEQVEIRNIILY